MVEKKEEVDIIEEDYMSQGATSPKELVLRHMDRISQSIFKGDTNPTIKQGKEGMISQPTDRRIIFVQAIEFLSSMLQPYYDDIMKTYQKIFDKLNESIENNLIISSINTSALEKSKDDLNKFKELVTLYQDKQIISINKDSSCYEVYLIEKHSAFMGFFKELNGLLYRKKYLEGEVFGE